MQNPAQTYQEYYGPAMFEPLAQTTVGEAALLPGERVLDVACGTGIVTRAAAVAVGAQGRVVGVDVNPRMLEVARAQPDPGGAPITYAQGDAQRLDIPDGSVDAVLCQQGLQFVSDRQAAVRQMRRVLRPAGRAVVSVWRGHDVHPLFETLARIEVPHLARFGVNVTSDDLAAPFSLADAAELRRLLAGAGFTTVKVLPVSIEARFATAARFVERLETAYAAVVPRFLEDPEAFAAYLSDVSEEARDLVADYRDGDEIVVPMHLHLATARP